MHYASLFLCTRAAHGALHMHFPQPLFGSNLSRHLRLRRLRFAAFAPSFPKAVRVFFGKCATVRLLFAARAAFFTLRRAAVRCLELAIAHPTVAAVRDDDTEERVSDSHSSGTNDRPQPEPVFRSRGSTSERYAQVCRDRTNRKWVRAVRTAELVDPQGGRVRNPSVAAARRSPPAASHDLLRVSLNPVNRCMQCSCEYAW